MEFHCLSGIVFILEPLRGILVPVEKKQMEVDHLSPVLDKAFIPIQRCTIHNDVIASVVSFRIVFVETEKDGPDCVNFNNFSFAGIVFEFNKAIILKKIDTVYSASRIKRKRNRSGNDDGIGVLCVQLTAQYQEQRQAKEDFSFMGSSIKYFISF